MKRIMLLLAGYIYICIPIAIQADTKSPNNFCYNLSISEFSHAIYHRHYFINRISEIITLFMKNNQVANTSNICLFSQQHINNKVIQQTADEIVTLKNPIPDLQKIVFENHDDINLKPNIKYHNNLAYYGFRKNDFQTVYQIAHLMLCYQ